MAAYNVINGTDTALATGGSTAPAYGIQVGVTLTDANLATLGALANVAVVKDAATAFNYRDIASVLLNNAVAARRGWRRW